MYAIHNSPTNIDFDTVLGPDPDALVRGRISRRRLLQFCAGVAATMGLSSAAGVRMAEAATGGERPPVIWLHGQECTGCTEIAAARRASDARIADPRRHLARLPRDAVRRRRPAGRVDYKHAMMAKHKGKYVLVIEGAIPMKDGGIYCKVGGKTHIEHVREAAEGAAAVIAIGSCASWGGIQSADPNPTGAVGTQAVIARQAGDQHPGLPAEPVQFPLHRSLSADLRPAARARSRRTGRSSPMAA